jgi:anti-sigma factor RsiW
MTCREVVELVSDYIDGALPPDVAARLDEHLEGCEHCTEYVAQMRATVRATAVAVGELELRPDRDALLDAFRRFRADS